MIIVLFHALYLFGKYLYENFHNRKEETEDTMVTNQLLNVSEADYQNSTETTDELFSENVVKIKFFPPVYVQRYNTVQSVLTSGQYHGKIQKVIDFGCAELTFAIHLKNTDGIQEIYCIDVDRPLLENFQTKVAPLHCDYLSLRTEPLTIHVCEGSIAHNDNKLANSDAVICIELIEHLYPDDLEAFPYNVFGFIKPQVAIITTPNADFNVLFQLNGFRHADHKFEWTRAQFQDWATNIVLRYPDYEVSFHGIGAGPGGTEHLGSCSQMAVFHRHMQLHDKRPEGVDGLLKTVICHKYPYRADNRSDEEKILAEVEYYIRLFSSRDEELCEEIPLEKLMFSVKKFRISIEILRSVLEEANWAVTDRESGPVVIIPPQSTFSLNSDVDFDDFFDNDYRQHGDGEDWDTLEAGAPRSSYFSDSYMERDPQNHEDEENWDDEVHDTRHSSSSNLNNENLPNSEHVSETVDRISDSQWIVEHLNTEAPSLNSSQQQISLTINHFDTKTELPSNSFLIGLDSTDTNHLDVSNDTITSSKHNLSSPLPLSDLSETSHPLVTDSDQSFSVNRSPTLPKNDFGGSSHSKEDLKFKRQADACGNSVSSSLQLKDSKSQVHDNNRSMPNNGIPNTEFQISLNLLETKNDSQNCAIQVDVYLPCDNHDTRSLTEDTPTLGPEFGKNHNVDCNSAHNETSSVSTVEAMFLLSNESMILDKEDPLLNAQELLGNKELLNNGRAGLNQSIDGLTQGCSTLLLLTDQSALENDDDHDLCSIYLQPSSISDDSLYQKNKISNLSMKDLSAATNKSYKNLDVSGDSIDSSHRKCVTALIDTEKIELDGIKSHDRMSFISISDCSLDLKPKYTSSPQIVRDIHKTQAQNETKTQRFLDKHSLHNYKCTPTSLQTTSQTTQSPNIDTDYENTYQSNTKAEIREILKIHSLVPKINSICINDASTRDENTLHKGTSLEGKKIVDENAIPNWPESKTVENISPSPSQLSLQSNSNISLSTVTSTGSSNVDKWYAAETNPMYQQDIVSLKGGNDTADDPNEETTSDSDATASGSEKGKDKEASKVIDRKSNTFDCCYKKTKIIQDTDKNSEDDLNMHEIIPEQLQNSNRLAAFLLTVQKTDDNTHHFSLNRPDLTSNLRLSGLSRQIGNEDLQNFDILSRSTSERSQLQSVMSGCRSTPSNEVSTSYNVGKMTHQSSQLKNEFDPARGLENVESKPFSPESLDTPPNSWSPEIMDSGYPNSASVHDITPEYDLSSIANDRISDSDSASVGEVPVPGFYEFVEVENGDLANNNRDDEGNNVIAFEVNDLDDLQPLIDVLENDMENENDIYVLQNGFPLWLLRILEMANPIDLEGMGGPQVQLYPAPLEQAGGDAPNANVENDEGFDSSSSDDNTDIEDDEADDGTTISSDETEDHSAENLRGDWRAGGDP